MKNNYLKTVFLAITFAAIFAPGGLKAQFTLQLLHASDLEGGVDAIERAPNFAAIIDGLEDEYANTIILAAGDNYIPGPFFSAAADGSLRQPLRDFYNEFYGGTAASAFREGVGRVDVTIMNAIGFDASALGNHEFDAGTSTIADIIGPQFGSDGVRWVGSQFPYLSANLDFSGDGALSGLFVSTIENTTFFQGDPATLTSGDKKSIAPATLISRGGELIGVVGATTPLLASISSPGDTEVQNPGAGTNDMVALASILQPVVDDLIAAGSNKIILVSHLQQVQLEQALILLLNGVDIVIAGGSDVILANAGDELNPGDADNIFGDYPLQTTNADGDPAVIVSTDGEYSYVGRLVVSFDDAGILDLSSIADVSGPYATTEAKVTEVWGSLEAAFAEGTKGAQVTALTDAVLGVVTTKDGNTFGSTSVFLEGRRAEVRTEETNLGNFTADANLWFAQQVDATVAVSIKNGGGIRAAIGEVDELSNGDFAFLPPQANPISGKMSGEISQLDIENSMRFNNALTLLSLTATDMVAVLEHGVSATAPGATPGQFGQVGGVRFSFDPSLPANSRIQNAVIVNADGATVDTLVQDGAIYGDAERTIRVVTLSFLADGGDSYPFEDFAFDRVDLQGNVPAEVTDAGVADFTASGTEQDAFAEYTAAFFSNEPFANPETPVELDGRIQNLSFRADAIFVDPATVEFDEEFVNVMEGAGTISIDVDVDNPRDVAVSVSLIVSAASTAVEGTQFSLGDTQMAMPGESTLSFDVEILEDMVVGGKFIALQFSPNEGVAPGDDDTFVVLIQDNDKEQVLPPANPSLTMTVINSLTTPDGAIAEISAYDAASQRLFTTNAEDNQLFIYDLSDLSVTNIIATIEIAPFGGNINSVDVYNGLVAVAVEAEETGENGSVLFLDIDGNELNSVTVGFLPDMVVFNNDGTKVLTANEGEPNDDYDLDPVGSISIIDLTAGVAAITDADVTEAGFESFNDQADALRAQGVRIFGPGASVAQDLEPEYITISSDNTTAYVSLQENNAVAVVDIATATVTAVVPLGFKDHSLLGNQIDLSDRSDNIFLSNWNNVKGMYMPDAIATFNIAGVEYLITANEGDAREYDGFEEEERVKDLDLDPAAFPFADILQRDELLGRYTVTTQNGDMNEDGLYEMLFGFGGRSFTIWNAATGTPVYDSGDAIECAVASDPVWGQFFNSNDDELELLTRSDNKGPEPEGVTTGVIDGKTYAFVILERMGGVMAFDVSDPAAPTFVQYLNNRDDEDGELGDLAPEGIIFVPAADSPNGENILLVSNEVSGTITVISLGGMDEPELCENFVYYMADNAIGGSSDLYKVTLTEGAAEMEYIATSPEEVHIAYNELDNLIYAVTRDFNGFRTINPHVESPAYSGLVDLGADLPQITTAVFNADGKLLVGSQSQNRIYAIDVMNGNAVTTFANNIAVEGGDLEFGNDGQLYLASRTGQSLFSLIPSQVLVSDVNLPNAVTGMMINAAGNQVLVSNDGGTSLKVRNIDGSDPGTEYALTLNGVSLRIAKW